MNQISPLKLNTGTPEIESNKTLAFCIDYKRRELSLNVVNQLNHLVKDAQRYRGISMGLLAGNRAFEKDFFILQNHIDRRIATFEVFAETGGDLGISTGDKMNLQQAWETIRHDWQEDKLSDNFELHSYFIDQLLQVNLAISKTLERSIIDVDGDSSPLSKLVIKRHAERLEVLNFTCALLPQIIETMAKIRGLASFSAAMGSAQYDHDRKLRFLLQTARQQNDKIRHCAQRLHDILGGKLTAKYVIGELETKFVHLIELVTHDVLSGATINSSSSQLFSLATQLIDKYWAIVDECLNLLRQWHREDIEHWVTW